MKKIHIFLYLGGSRGTLTSNRGLPNLQGLTIPHHRADKFITRGKNNHQFFIYGLQREKICILGYSGGGGGLCGP